MKRSRLTSFVAVTCALLPAARAVTYTYTPTDSTTDLWSLGTNWSAIPVGDIDTALIFGPVGNFPSAGPITNSNFNDELFFPLNSLTLEGVGPAAAGNPVTVSISGGTLDFINSSTSVGPILNLTASNGTAGSTVTYNVDSALQLDNNLTITGNGNATFNFTSFISGTGGITKTGNSAVSLLQGNSYSGATALNGGVISINQATALGDSSITNTISFNGGTLATTGFFNLGVTRTVALNGAGTFQVAAGGVLTVDGVVSGSGSLTKGDAGALVLSATNTYSGQTTIAGGVLRINAAANLGDASATNTLRFNGAGATLESTANTYNLGTSRAVTLTTNGTFQVDAGSVLTVDGAVSGTGGLGKTQTGTLILAGANTYSGPTTIDAGTVRISAGNNLGDASATNTIIINTATLESTANTYNLGSNRAITLNGTGTVQVDATSVLTIDGVISGVGALTKTQTGTLVLSGANTYSGQTTITGGIVKIGAANSLGDASATNTIRIAGTLESTGGIYNLGANRSVTMTGGTTLQSDAGTLTVDGGITNTNATLTVTGAGNVNLSGPFGGSTGGLTKTGAGTLTLGGNNSYSGVTALNGGTVVIGSSTAFGTGTADITTATSAPTIQGDGTARIISNPFKPGVQNTTLGGASDLTFNGLVTNFTSGTQGFLVNNSGLTTFHSGYVFSNTTTARVPLIRGTGNLTIEGLVTPNATAGAIQSLSYLGSGTLSLSSANGGTLIGISTFVTTLQIATGAAAGAGEGNSTLKILGNYTIGSAGSTVLTIKGGNGTTTTQGTLSLVDGTVNTLALNSATAGATVFNIANGSGLSSNLKMEVGASSDAIVLGTGLKLAPGTGGISVSITGLGSLSGTQQTLLSGILASGSFASFTLGVTDGNFSGRTVSLGSDATHLYLVESAPNADPATAYWKGNVSSIWNGFKDGNLNTTNWTSDVAGATSTNQSPGPTTNVLFSVAGGGANLATTLGANATINSLTFTADAGTSKPVSIGGNTLTLNAGTAGGNPAGNGLTVNASSGAHTINSNVALGASQTWTVANDPANPLTVNGPISGSTFGLAKSGTGTLVLGGSNTFTGGLTINNGVVRLNNAGALNATVPQSVTFGAAAPATAILQLNGQTLTVGALSTNATPGSPIVENASATPGTITISQATATTYAGVLRDGSGGGALSFTKSGVGALTLSGANTFTGLTSVANGALYLNGRLTAPVHVSAATDNATAVLGGTGDGFTSGLLSGAVTVQTPTGTGRLNEITAGTTSTTGALTLGAGLTIESGGIAFFNIFDAGASDLINVSGGGLTLSSGANIRVPAGLSTAHEYTLFSYTGTAPSLAGVLTTDLNGGALGSSYTFSVGSGIVKLVIASASSAIPTLSITNPVPALRVMSGTSVAVSGFVGNTGTLSLSGGLSDNGGQLTVSGFSPTNPTVAAGGSVPYSATIANTGTTLGSRTYTVKVTDPAASPTTATAGSTLTVLADRQVSASPLTFGSLHVGAAVSTSTSLTSVAPDDQATRVTVANAAADGNGLAVTGGSPATIFNGATSDSRTVSGTFSAIGVKNGPITLTTTGEGISGEAPINVSLAYSAQIYSGKAAWKNAAGGAWSAGANWGDTQSGDLGGAGAPGVDGALSAGDTATFGDFAGAASTLNVTLDGANPSVAALAFNAAASSYTIATGTVGILTLQGAATPIDVSATALTPTLSATLSGAASGLNKTGPGTLVLAGASNYGGLTSIANGAIQIASGDNRLPTTTALVLGDATANTSGALILGQTSGRAQTLAGLTTAGTGLANKVVGGSATNSTLTLNIASGTNFFSGTLGGPGPFENNLGLTKIGAGVLALTGTNTYLGGTILTAGTLNLGSAGAIGTAGTITFAGGTLQFSPANTTDYTSRFVTTGNSAYSLDTNGQFVTLANPLLASGTSGITKFGAGTLLLGADPTTTGPADIRGGVLQTLSSASLATSQVKLTGASGSNAVWQTNGTVTRNLSATNAPGNLTWSTFSGFAAKGGSLTVTLNAGAGIVWNAGNFLGAGTAPMVLGSPTADSPVTMTNDINLNTADQFNRVIFVEQGTGGDRALLSGIISGGTALKSATGIEKQGGGTLILSNAANSYSGETLIAAGTLVAAGNVPAGLTVGDQGNVGVFGTGSGASGHGQLDGAGPGLISSATLYNVTLGTGNTTVAATPTLMIGGAFSFDRPVIIAGINAANYVVGGNTTSTASYTNTISANRNFSITQTANGTLNFTGTNGGGVALRAAAGSVTATFDDAGAVNVSGAIANGGGILGVTKVNAGTATFSGINSYTGPTLINGGMLVVNGSISGSAVTVGNGGTLTGGTLVLPSSTGSILVDTGGTLAPGQGLGAMNVSDLNFNAAATFKLDINTSLPDTDHVFGTGALGISFTDDVALSITDLGGNVPLEVGATFPFITYNGNWNGGLFSVNGTPIADDTTFVYGANTFTLDYNNGSNAVALVVAIPEPTTTLSVLGGLGMLIARRRRRK